MENEAQEIANTLVPDMLDRAAGNIDELLRSICRWEAEDEGKMCNQKLQQELHHFFNMRRVFAEHQSSEEEEEEEGTEMDATQGPSKNTGKPTGAKRHTSGLYKKITSAWKSVKTVKGYFTKKGGKVQPDPHDEESGRQSSSPPQEATSPTSVCSNEDISIAPNTDVLTVPLDVENLDSVTPGTSRVQLEAQQDVGEVVRSVTRDLPSKNIEQEPGELSTSSDEDMSATMEENASRSCQPQNDKQVKRHTSVFYKQMKSTWKNMKSVNLFTKKRGNRDHPVQDQLEEDATDSGSQKSDSPPQEASPIPSVPSKEDNGTAARTDPITAPQELADVDNEDKDVTPVGFMEEDLVTAMDATPRTSETKPREMSPMADPTKTSCESDSKTEKQAVVSKKKETKKFFFPLMKRNKVQPAVDQHEEEAPASGSQSKLSSVHSSEDTKVAVKTDVSPAPLEPVDVDEQAITPMEKGIAPEPSTIISAPSEYCEKRSSVTVKDPVKERDSTPGPSRQGKQGTNMVAMKTDLSLVPLEKVDVDKQAITPMQKGIAPKPSTIISAPSEYCEKRSSVTVKDLVKERDSTPGPSCQGKRGTNMVATKTDLSLVPLEKVDVDNEDVTPMEKEDFGSKPSTGKDPVMERESTPNMVAITTDLSPVPLELMNVDHKNIRPMDKQYFGSEPSTVEGPVKERDSTPNMVAMTTDLNPVPQELMDVDNEDKDVTPVGFMEEDLVTAMDATPRTSETKPREMSPMADPTKTSSESDSKTEKQAVVSKKKETKKIFFSLMKRNKVQPAVDQHEEEAPTSGSQSKLSSVHSSEDTKVAVKTDVSPVPLEPVDVDEQAITPMQKGLAPKPSTIISAPSEYCEKRSSVTVKDLVKERDSTPGPSRQGKQGTNMVAMKTDLSLVPLEKVDVDKQAIRPMEKGLAPKPSTIISAPSEYCEKRSSVTVKDLVKERDSTPRPSRQGKQGTNMVAMKTDLSVVPLEKVDVDKQAIRPMEKGLAPEPSTIISAPSEYCEKRSSVTERQFPFLVKEMDSTPGPSGKGKQGTNMVAIKTYLSPVPLEKVDVGTKDMTPMEKQDFGSKPSTVEDPVMEMDSIPGPSGQGEQPKSSQEASGAEAQLITLRIIFYHIIRNFFKSLTGKQLKDMNRGVYPEEVKEQLTEMCMKILRLVIESITNNLSDAVSQNGSTSSPTCSQDNVKEQVGQDALVKLLRKSFDITEDHIEKTVKGSLGEALYDVLDSDHSIDIPPNVPEIIVKTVTDELNSILSETIQSSLNKVISCSTTAACCQFSSCRKCKKMLTAVVGEIKFWLTFQDIASKFSIRTGSGVIESANGSKDPKNKLLWWSCFMRWRKSQLALKKHLEDAIVLSSRDICSLSPRPTSSISSEDDEDITSEEHRCAPSTSSHVNKITAEKNNRISQVSSKWTHTVITLQHVTHVKSECDVNQQQRLYTAHIHYELLIFDHS
ncbi:uncharacterized protein LOC121904915 [Scomber scombrus]|uniref:Uncharacterized protein LOC121904915 n=1 Tax=Scomber scombrus TaxID=13677 RepID=A0AAV1QDH8_SCOSC